MLTLKNILLTLFVWTAAYSVSFAQHTYFAPQGTIHYEKTIFLKNLIKRYASYENDPSKRTFFTRFVDQVPENLVYKKTLAFNEDEVLFQHVKESQPEMIQQLAMSGIFESGVNSYQNLKKKEMRSLFELGGQEIYVQDSLVNTKWRITNEYRNIAGYNCRRANGIVMDSIYVVAFYTDEIPVSAGPSVFNGLPGTIMGLAIPELHYNIFATKVDLAPVPLIDGNLAKKKAKPLTRDEVYNQLKSVVGGFLGEKIFNLVMVGYFL